MMNPAKNGRPGFLMRMWQRAMASGTPFVSLLDQSRPTSHLGNWENEGGSLHREAQAAAEPNVPQVEDVSTRALDQAIAMQRETERVNQALGAERATSKQSPAAI